MNIPKTDFSKRMEEVLNEQKNYITEIYKKFDYDPNLSENLHSKGFTESDLDAVFDGKLLKVVFRLFEVFDYGEDEDPDIEEGKDITGILVFDDDKDQFIFIPDKNRCHMSLDMEYYRGNGCFYRRQGSEHGIRLVNVLMNDFEIDMHNLIQEELLREKMNKIDENA